MKCTNCGFPLSPTNASMTCPRCHTFIASGPGSVAQQPSPQPAPSSSPWTTGKSQNQITLSPVEQKPFPQLGQFWQSAPTPESMPATLSHNSASYDVPTRTAGATYSSPSAPAPSIRPRAQRTSNLGFIIAGLCVFAGGLLLIFVYIMALELPSPDSTTSFSTAPAITN